MNPRQGAALLEQVAIAYRRGYSQPYTPEVRSANEPFWATIDEIQSTRVDLNERLLLRRCRAAVNQGLDRARQGKYASCLQYLREARRIAVASCRTVETRSLARSVLAAGQAYVSYRRGRLESARRRLQRALELDLRLEREAGYAPLHLHRLTLLHNLADVDWKQGGAAEAATGLVNLVLYLAGAIETLPGLECSDGHVLDRLPQEFVRSQMLAYASDLAERVAISDGHPANAWLDAVGPLTTHRDTRRFAEPIWHAFRIKAALLDNQSEAYLRMLAQFLEKGRGAAPRLWYSAVADLVGHLSATGLPQAPLLRAQILSDAASWPDLPQALRLQLPRAIAA